MVRSRFCSRLLCLGGAAFCLGALPVQAQQQAASPAVQTGVAPDIRAAAQVLAQLHKTTRIREGQGPRVLTVFFDPNCPYCRQLYSALRPYVGKDGLQVDWVPVAILAPSSAAKAATILQAKDRLQAFRATEEHGLDPNRPAPALPGEGQITAATGRILAANVGVLKQAGVYESVPLAVYRDRSGLAQLAMGAPRDQAALRAWLQSIGP